MNSIFNDRRMEARDLKRTAERLKVGAPLGPRLAHDTATDEEGTYTIFTGKVCRVCDCQLTSRNRYGAAALCFEHGREHERNRVRRPSGAVKRAHATAATEPSDAGASSAEQCPYRKAVHRALSGFLYHPTDECAYAHTIAVMHEYELRARLLQVLPTTTNESTP